MRLSNRILVFLAFCAIAASASAQERIGSETSSFSRFNFTAGGGFGIGRDDAASYVGDSSQVMVGGGVNLSRLFGVDAEYMYYNLGFKSSVIQQQALVGQSGHMQSISLNGIVNVPRHFGKAAAYGIFGIGFYDRSVSLAHGQFLANGTPCQPAWRWWDLTCVTTNPQIGPTIQVPGPPFGETISSNSKVAGGFNYGGGITYKLDYLNHAKLFVEVRYHRAYQADGQTIVMPITVGLRW